MKEMIRRIVEGENLDRQEAEAAFGMIMDGKATEAQIAGFLVGLRMKGETPEEIVGGAMAMRERAMKVPTEHVGAVVDTCGTGGDGAHTFNVSTAAAIIAAACGVAVAKHGNRSVSSSSGSADVLAELGIRTDLQPEEAALWLQEHNFAFLFAPIYHSAMKHAAGPRRELGVRTIFNMLGPLTNPAGVRYQVMGVYDGAMLETVGEVMALMGMKHAMVVHGRDGLDEISPTAPTDVVEVREGTMEKTTIIPEDFGMQGGGGGRMVVESPGQSAEIIREVLEGKEGPALNAALLNAAAAVYVAGGAADLASALEETRECVYSGKAVEKLQELVDASKRGV